MVKDRLSNCTVKQAVRHPVLAKIGPSKLVSLGKAALPAFGWTWS